MAPQQIPFYSPALASGAPPVYGQPGFYHSNSAPQAQGLAVQVGVPAGVPVFASAVQQAFVHVAPTGFGNVPFSTSDQQTHFVQGQQNNFVQGMGPDTVYAAAPSTNLPGQRQGQPKAPRSPPPSSFPPGFEPGHNNNFAMGVPSTDNVAMVVHPNQQHIHYEHQQVNQHQQQYQHRHHQQQQQQQQQQPHHQHLHPHQPQPQHQYQHQQHQPQHHPQYQHQHQQQNQHLNQHQRQLQHEHQHQHDHQHQCQHYVQQQSHFQQQQNQHSHSHLQMQAQLHQNSHSYSHSHPQLQLQTQPHPGQLQTQPHAQPQPQLQTLPRPAQLQTQPQPQPQPQAQPACQQVQLIPAPFSNSLHAFPSNIQADFANGVAIGVPVMPTSSHVDTIASQTAIQIQQPAPAWQPSCPENSLSLQCAPQSSNGRFAFSNNGQDNGSRAIALKKDPHSNGWKPPNIQRNDYLSIERETDSSQERAQVMPPMKPDSQSRAEAMKPLDAQRIDQMQSNGHLASGASHPSSSTWNNHRHWGSPSKSQMPARGNGRNTHNVLRSFQSHISGQLKSHMNGLLFSAAGEKCSNGQRIPQMQRPCDSRRKSVNKDMQERSGMQQIKCDPCDRTFTSSEILATHLMTHVKCGEEGCTFEASGKIVKEHKVTEHGKVDIQATYRGRKALALWSIDDKEDIKRWREERKKSFPTSANILRKAEERKRKEAEGEHLDEESQKRRQRMRDVINRQKQLGYQVPEIPSHYFHTRHDGRPKKKVREETAVADISDRKTEFVERRNIVGLKKNVDDTETSHDRPVRVEDVKNDNQTELIGDDNDYQRRSHFRKGHQRKSMSWREGQKHFQNYDARMPRPRSPTLLSKLLRDDIQKESTHLLQCCRFIVNNAFLQDCSPTSLKHFEWIAAATPSSKDGSSANVLDSKAQLESEVGEEVPISSSSKMSEHIPLLDSKNSVLEVEKKVIDAEDTSFVICKPSLSNSKDFVSGRQTEAAPHAPAIFAQKFGSKSEEQDLVHSEPPESNVHQPCHENGAGNVESKVDSSAQNLSVGHQPSCSKHPNVFLGLNDSQANHCAIDKVVRSVHTSVSTWKPSSTSTHPSYDDMEAGEVVSGLSGSIVEDEEDISQYMNFDANGADSGSCYD